MDLAVRQSGSQPPSVRRLRVTRKRIDANRRNAMRSTGPRSPQGKARVRLNALRHGLRARDETCLASAGEEAQRKIAENVTGLNDYFHPANREEEAIIAEVALNMWKADRAFALDMQSRWWEMRSGDPDWPRMRKWVYALIRYDNRAHRMIYRGFDALLKSRRMRGVSFKYRRTKPLAARSPAGPTRSRVRPIHGDGGLRLSQPLPHLENVRSKPLASVPPPLPNTLRGLTLVYWERERNRARCARWQK